MEVKPIKTNIEWVVTAGLKPGTSGLWVWCSEQAHLFQCNQQADTHLSVRSLANITCWLKTEEIILSRVDECCGNYCLFTFVLWGGFCLVLFQSFVICHFLFCWSHLSATPRDYRQCFAIEANPLERLAGRLTSKLQQKSLLAGPNDFSHLMHYFFLDLITDIGCMCSGWVLWKLLFVHFCFVGWVLFSVVPVFCNMSFFILLIASVCNTKRLPPVFCHRGKSTWKTCWEVNLKTPTKEPSCRSKWLLPFNALFFLRFNYWYRVHKGTWTLLCMESLPC